MSKEAILAVSIRKLLLCIVKSYIYYMMIILEMYLLLCQTRLYKYRNIVLEYIYMYLAPG